MTKIYSVWDGDEFLYYPTKSAAIKEARNQAKFTSVDEEIDVEECIVADLPKRDLYCRLLEGGWCDSKRKIAIIKGKSAKEESE